VMRRFGFGSGFRLTPGPSPSGERGANTGGFVSKARGVVWRGEGVDVGLVVRDWGVGGDRMTGLLDRREESWECN
jgi:hypothetical protein